MRTTSMLRSLLFTLALVAAPACVTQSAVRDIVHDSNAALEASAILRDTDRAELGNFSEDSNPSLAPDAGLQKAVQQIDAFIAEHPDLKGVTNDLTIRKAALLLFAGRSNEAAIAFEAYDPNVGGNARDRALYESRDVLAWWWPTAGALNPPVADFPAKVSELTTVIDSLPPSGIRYYLATTRAQMHLKWALLEPDRRPRLKAGLTAYCSSFNKEGQKRVKAWIEEDFAGMGQVPTSDWRWYGQAAVTFEAYRKAYQDFLDDPDERPEGLAVTETAPVWDDACRWLVELVPPGGG